MNYNEDEEVEDGFKMNSAEDDDILEGEGEIPELPVDDDDDPENRFH